MDFKQTVHGLQADEKCISLCILFFIFYFLFFLSKAIVEGAESIVVTLQPNNVKRTNPIIKPVGKVAQWFKQSNRYAPVKPVGLVNN